MRLLVRLRLLTGWHRGQSHFRACFDETFLNGGSMNCLNGGIGDDQKSQSFGVSLVQPFGNGVTCGRRAAFVDDDVVAASSQ